MSLVSWNPIREMESLFDRYHRSFARPGVTEAGEVAEYEWAPSVDISETDKEYLISADLPGVDKKDIKITVHNGVLRIEGQRRVEKKVDQARLHRVERFYGQFTRQFTLPEDADAGQITAHSQDGTLEIRLPRMEPKESQSVQIKVH